MNSVITLFWNICRFRAAPQDLPTSASLLWMMVIAHVIIGTCAAGVHLSPGPALASAILNVGVLAGVVRLTLWVRELDVRMNQTLTSILGTGILFGLILVPLLWWQLSYEDIRQALLPSFFGVALFVWQLAVIGHILRHAVNVAFYVGVGLAILYAYIADSVFRSFFTIPTAQ
ncbi:hypothetical protein ACFL2V_10820 [Pseudomonadota bacterium]